MQPLIHVALNAARAAGKIIANASERLDKVKTAEKTVNDYVTNVDCNAEQAIIEIIREAYPDHGILGEEGGHHEGDYRDSDEIQWIIDPLDGTANFINGFQHYAVSIALKVNNHLECAVIYDPIRHDVFTAMRGQGAQLNNHKIRISQKRTLSESLIATGLPFRDKEQLDRYLLAFKTLFHEASDIRRTGSAALDLAYVAADRLGGFWEYGLKPWDIAAGALLVKEAGGLVSDFKGSEDYLSSGNIVAANPKILKQMLQAIHPAFNDIA